VEKDQGMGGAKGWSRYGCRGEVVIQHDSIRRSVIIRGGQERKNE